LREYVIGGITTNIPFHLALLDEPDFIAGRLSTHFIPEHPQLAERTAEWAERKRTLDRALRDGARIAAIGAAVAVTM
ncbi:MAG TPA: acetyl-CoA carboxylase biotin carboxylase subunit, partial [Candidatus Dormibacteraeota bacterium]|nr:acetyl-CoA carboxylase biotin carboxylase subunit [Candidatus Dormibacteraeota bacterium]